MYTVSFISMFHTSVTAVLVCDWPCRPTWSAKLPPEEFSLPVSYSGVVMRTQHGHCGCGSVFRVAVLSGVPALEMLAVKDWQGARGGKDGQIWRTE